MGAIAKGVRRARSRFGGRLEPFFRLRIELHEGRGELLTVTGAQTVDGHARLRERRARARRGGARVRRGRAPVRDLRAAPGRVQPAVPQAGAARRAGGRGAARGRAPIGARAAALAFRLKLLLAAGLAPQLGACATCGEREHLVGFSGAAGGVVCGGVRGGVVPARRGGVPLHDGGARRAARTRRPTRREPALGQVERAIAATLEHHAHLRLMPAARARRAERALHGPRRGYRVTRMDEGLPIAYEVLEKGVPVLGSDGEQVGTVAPRRGGARAGHLPRPRDRDRRAAGRRFVEAADVASLHERGVDLRIDAAAAQSLPEPGGGAPVYDEDPGEMKGWRHWVQRGDGLRGDWKREG